MVAQFKRLRLSARVRKPFTASFAGVVRVGPEDTAVTAQLPVESGRFFEQLATLAIKARDSRIWGTTLRIQGPAVGQRDLTSRV